VTANRMRAWVVSDPGPIDEHPLELVDLPIPEPGPGEIRVRVLTCGVCRTYLHLAEGYLPPRHARVVPGQEVVGAVDAAGRDAHRFAEGDRVGVPWLAHTCGVCRFCTSQRENLCIAPGFTGWDAHGGYAEYLLAEQDYAYALPAEFDDVHAAPLLCAGIIGYRALRQSNCPPAGRLGIYGFGGSAHLAAQVALSEGLRVHVLTRSVDAQRLALELGVASAGGAADPPPEPLDRGGTLAIAGIYLSDIPTLDYQRHLFQERSLRSVTANTRDDGRSFLQTAADIHIQVSATPYEFERANEALRDLAHDRVNGAAVLVMPS